MLKAAIVGATGYTGEELVRILIGHPQVKITSLSAKIDKPLPISELCPDFKGKVDLVCKGFDLDEVAGDSELVFLAVPHGVAVKLAPSLLEKGKIVIDLSADFRLKDVSLYPKHYGFSHEAPKLLGEAVYGLPEIYRQDLKKANLIANPGCFPTSVILGILPLAKKNLLDKSSPIFVDAKTGLTGAGREAVLDFLASEAEENVRAYKVTRHQHQVEMEQILAEAGGGAVCQLVFVPHLIPIQRGILSTIYLQLQNEKEEKEIWQIFKNFYRDEPFVQVLELEHFPETKSVRMGNFCQIGLRRRGKVVVVIAAIDNLVKGAAGQAVQNMNIRFGFPEDMGLGVNSKFKHQNAK
ncbi:MAG: N-acetyl-gamma-glutamyl-phosphate reductase [Candidatus Ratteibacteria bacterium]|nr:N-acetyl-gamma-glutamyl-phosphate reductase [Candidatus Ratteibacteria bacterium]